MSHPRSRQGSERDTGAPKWSGHRTIAEESRERWTPDHPDVKEAGDDGPHRTESTDGTTTVRDE